MRRVWLRAVRTQLRSLRTVAKQKLAGISDSALKTDETKALFALDAKVASARLVKFLLQVWQRSVGRYAHCLPAQPSSCNADWCPHIRTRLIRESIRS
jgi:hypothetical protein